MIRVGRAGLHVNQGTEKGERQQGDPLDLARERLAAGQLDQGGVKVGVHLDIARYLIHVWRDTPNHLVDCVQAER